MNVGAAVVHICMNVVFAVVVKASFISNAVILPWSYNKEIRCYDGLGCLNITSDWYSLRYRPFNVFPLSRSAIDTKFILYTRSNSIQSQGQILRAGVKESIENSNFDPQKETKFIVHGFIDTGHVDWVQEMYKELLINSDWNVIIVDWGGGSLPLYTQATANTRLVGMEIANLINYLKEEFGLKPEDVHIIGHSLGAHTAGYAGERVEGLGRITALDPAEPYFQGMPTFVRLDPSDANFVDVIHTDGNALILFGYGMTDAVGHLDFYPNGGSNQPGCEGAENAVPLTAFEAGIEEASRMLVACNHCRAIKYFTESINRDCPFVGYRCANYKDYLSGRCFSCSGTGCAIMGLHAHKTNLPLQGSKYYMATSKRDPFCRYQYRLTLDLVQPKSLLDSSVEGNMRATLYSGVNARTLDLTPRGIQTFKLGRPNSFIAIHRDVIDSVEEASLSWKPECFYWCEHIYVRSVKFEKATTNSIIQKSNLKLLNLDQIFMFTINSESQDFPDCLKRGGVELTTAHIKCKEENEKVTTLCSVEKDYADMFSGETSNFTRQCD